jgi:peptide/bleomycin uptake transporter
MFGMFAPFFKRTRWSWVAYSGGIFFVVIICVNVYAALQMSYVIKDLGTAIEIKASQGAYDGIILRLIISSCAFILTDLCVYWIMRPLYTWYWTEALSEWYLERWHAHGTHIEGAAQRIQEGTKVASQKMVEFCSTVLRRFIGLIAFIPVIWELSSFFNRIVLPIHIDVASVILQNGYATLRPTLQFILLLPGVLLWLVLLISTVETLVSSYLGRKIAILEKKRQRAEAYWRSRLERAQSHRSAGGSKEDERVHIKQALKWLVRLRRRTVALTFLSLPLGLWGQMYGNFWGFWLQGLIGYLVAVYALFPYGVMMQTITVMGEVHGSFSVVSDYWYNLTEIRASLQRLQALDKEGTKL